MISFITEYFLRIKILLLDKDPGSLWYMTCYLDYKIINFNSKEIYILSSSPSDLAVLSTGTQRIWLGQAVKNLIKRNLAVFYAWTRSFHKIVLTDGSANKRMSQIKGSRELVCAKYFIERQKLSCLFWHIVMSYIVNVETVANGLLIPGSNSCLSTAIKVMKGTFS